MSLPRSSLTIVGSAVPTIVWSREARNSARRTAPTIAALARASSNGSGGVPPAEALKTRTFSRGLEDRSRQVVTPTRLPSPTYHCPPGGRRPRLAQRPPARRRHPPRGPTAHPGRRRERQDAG